MPDTNERLRHLHDTYHAGPDADVHPAAHGHAFRDLQPGTAEHRDLHLVGSAAPEVTIERWDSIGPEGFGPVEILDGRTGRSIVKLNSAARRRLSR
jgi:hypothetical protein